MGSISLGDLCHVTVEAKGFTWKFLGRSYNASVEYRGDYSSDAVPVTHLSFTGQMLTGSEGHPHEKLRRLALGVLGGDLEKARDLAFDVLMTKESSGA